MMSSRWKWGVRTLIFNFADFFLTRAKDLINKERLLVVLLNLKSKHLLKMNLSSWIRLNLPEFPFCNLAWPQWNTKIGCVSVRSQSYTIIVWCIIATKSIKIVTIRTLSLFFLYQWLENLSRLDFCAVAIRAIYCKEVCVLNWWVHFFLTGKRAKTLTLRIKSWRKWKLIMVMSYQDETLKDLKHSLM